MESKEQVQFRLAELQRFDAWAMGLGKLTPGKPHIVPGVPPAPPTITCREIADMRARIDLGAIAGVVLKDTIDQFMERYAQQAT